MKRRFAAGILLLMLVGAASAHAQEPRLAARVHGVSGFGPGRVERALGLRSALELTEAQTSQLEAIRKEEVTRRQNLMRDHIDLQSRAAAGQVTFDELRDEMRKLREATENSESSVRERIDRILTEQQRNRLGRERRIAAPGIRSGVLPATELMRRRALEQSSLRVRPRVHVPRPRSPPDEVRRRIDELRRRREGFL